MKRYDLLVVGAGPAGLSAAICAAKAGMKAAVFDENAKPGGQLFKQIHKFFGSKEHKAKIRGFRIGKELLGEAAKLGVEVFLNATVEGLYDGKEITVRIGDRMEHYKGNAVLVATGASENMIPFEGWTLPGVIGAGAAQTMMNLHHVKPGDRILMVGSGNVGLVVSFQLLQAGCSVEAIIDAVPKVGGYGVHAAKVARCSVPFYLSHTVVRAEGTDFVTGAVIAEVDSKFQPISGTEKHLDVDTICLAVGLSPMSQLLYSAGCKMKEDKGAWVPVCDEFGETSIPGVFAAGDVSGIEEASSAMIEGRIAGTVIAGKLGYLSEEARKENVAGFEQALGSLRQGMFAPQNRGKDIESTEEGIAVSANLLRKGYLSDEEIARFPGFTTAAGIHPVIECTQNIPCNPCQDACKAGCIRIGEKITSLPVTDAAKKCAGCGMCVASCPGQAIFLVDEGYAEGYASVTLPYEFLPLPKAGDLGTALDRSGKPLCEAEVVQVKSLPAFDHTNLLTMKVPSGFADRARFYRSEGEKVYGNAE